jgi:predicted aldo/keto reductase-like oxidoreductase
MEYRRFGKTNKNISVITLGGMRYKHGWDEPRDVIPDDSIEECKIMVELSLKAGINHIETAYGYTKSETLYGIVLNDVLKIPRSSYFLMTKGSPLTADETRRMVEEQLKALKTDFFDFYGWHGINNDDRYKTACCKGGPVEELLKMKEEGVIGHIGFSTHAPLPTILRTIETNLFDFINLHYYYFNQRNYAAVALAESKDMGVFIISPNDKGGMLYKPSDVLQKTITGPTPIQWNARFCLQNPSIHTLSFGMTAPSQVEEMLGIFPTHVPFAENDRIIWSKLEALKLKDPYWFYEGFELLDDPSGINIPEVLRLRKLWKCYNLKDFCTYRYNLFEAKDHWFPGVFATNDNIDKIDMNKVPPTIPLKDMLAEVHKEFYKPKK